jgi:hypothetical protein
MSDYLWDKSGEVDPEVERLEGMLGRLRHHPGRFAPPAIEVEPGAAPREARAGGPRLLRPAALVAAALALVAIAGLLLVLRDAGQSETQTVAADAAPAAGPTQTSSPTSRLEPEPVVASAGSRHAAPSVVPVKLRAADPAQSGRSERRRFRPATKARAEASAPAAVERDGMVRAEVSRLEAKERLLYALRLASVKLEEVRRLTAAGGESEEGLVGPQGRTR